MKRIGMLTSGGDCQALNATMRGVAKGLYNIYGSGVEIIGFIDGYKGLMYEDYKKLTPIDFTGLLTRGGTFQDGAACAWTAWWCWAATAARKPPTSSARRA